MEEKPTLSGLYHEQSGTPEGKYLVMRRDGTVPPWPSFVLGGPDPVAEVALRAYAAEVRRVVREEPERAIGLGLTTGLADSVGRWADEYARYREEHGDSDPGKGKHRADHPLVLFLVTNRTN